MPLTAARLRRSAARIGHVTLLAAFTLLLSFPFYWMVITAFKRSTDLLDVSKNPFLFNAPPTLEHLRVLFEQTDFGRWILNTLGVGALVVAITLLLSVPAGYALALEPPVRDRNLLDLPGASDHPFHSVLSHHRSAGLAGFGVVPGAGLSELHGTVLHMAADGVLQDSPARHRGGRHGGRS